MNESPTYILGVSMSSHDRAAALLRDGVVICAVSEERLDRRKKSQGFYASGGSIVLPPLAAITYVLREAGITLRDLTLVVCGRSITSCRATLLQYLLVDPDIVIEPDIPAHHLGHGYSAYITAPFDECDVLVVDEQGHTLPDGRFERWTSFCGGIGPLQLERQSFGRGGQLSLGMYFDIFAALTGLAEAGLPAAGKLMALAAYGQPRPEWPALMRMTQDGDAYADLAEMDAFLGVAGLPTDPRFVAAPITRLDDLRNRYGAVHWSSPLAADLARKAQDELEAAVLHVAGNLQQRTGHRSLAFAGGVALNCTANSRFSEAGYENVFVHPAATDDGVAVGLAGYGWVERLGRDRVACPVFSPYLGAVYGPTAIQEALTSYGLGDFTRPCEPEDVADLLVAGRVVCWFHGRSEWGPRALGARSILANAMAPDVVRRLNSEIKFREPFRPFGVSVAAEEADQLLDLAQAPAALAAYMLGVAKVRDDRLRTVTHRDGTVRYQTVKPEVGDYYRVLSRMRARIGIGAVLNTSFNTHGEPLVETPQDAIRQFLLCGADALYLESHLVELASLPQPVRDEALRLAWQSGALSGLDLAVQQEAAGFPEASRQALRRVPTRGMDEVNARARAALLMRLACAEGDTDEALRQADEVLRWSGMPDSAVAAAKLIAECGPSAQVPRRELGHLLAALGVGGGATATMRSVFQPEAAGAAAQP